MTNSITDGLIYKVIGNKAVPVISQNLKVDNRCLNNIDINLSYLMRCKNGRSEK